jgi:hypothetical protein
MARLDTERAKSPASEVVLHPQPQAASRALLPRQHRHPLAVLRLEGRGHQRVALAVDDPVHDREHLARLGIDHPVRRLYLRGIRHHRLNMAVRLLGRSRFAAADSESAASWHT